MSIDKQARRRSVEHFKSTQQAEGFVSLLPDPSEHDTLMATSDAAITYAGARLKPLRYASIARTMGVMFRDMFELDGNVKQRMSAIPADHPDNQWKNFLDNTSGLFTNAARAIEHQPEFQENEALNKLKSELLGIRTLSTARQLESGGITYANFAMFFLRNIPQLARAHNVPLPTQQAGVRLAKNSFSIPWNMAMRSVDQLVASEREMAKNPEIDMPDGSMLIGVASAVMQPSDVIARSFTDGNMAFGLREPHNPMISPGVNLSSGLLQEATPMQDLQSLYGEPTIGCPITLMKQQFEELWSLQAEVAGYLWECDRAPFSRDIVS